jgi:hypothetical protein
MFNLFWSAASEPKLTLGQAIVPAYGRCLVESVDHARGWCG